MRIKYKGKFREALLDYISDQPWMFELDTCGMSFFELPIAMQFGVVGDFADNFKIDIQVDLDGAFDGGFWYDWWVTDMGAVRTVKEGAGLKSRKEAIKVCVEAFQDWYNENK